MGKVHIHVHKRTKDGPSGFGTPAQLEAKMTAKWREIEAAEKLSKTQKGEQATSTGNKIQAMKREVSELEDQLAVVKRESKSKDSPEETAAKIARKKLMIQSMEKKLKIGSMGYNVRYDMEKELRGIKRELAELESKGTADAKPATDTERRERIRRVMQGADVTEAMARNMLEGEEWDVEDAVRELKHMRTLGFVIDSVRDGKVLYTKDATYWNIYIDGKVYKYEDTEVKANQEADKLRKDPANKGKTITVKPTGANTGAVQGHGPSRIFGNQ